jgi:hypothetical protein
MEFELSQEARDKLIILCQNLVDAIIKLWEEIKAILINTINMITEIFIVWGRQIIEIKLLKLRMPLFMARFISRIIPRRAIIKYLIYIFKRVIFV